MNLKSNVAEQREAGPEEPEKKMLMLALIKVVAITFLQSPAA